MLFATGGYCSLSLYNKATEAFVAWKEHFIETEVVEYLKTHPIEIDTRKNKPVPPEVRKEDLLKMVFVTHNRMSQCELSMQMIKDTINLTENK